MTSRPSGAIGRVGSLLATASALLWLDAGAAPAHATLRGERDVDRAIEALYDEDDDEVRARAARWLGTHGPDEVVLEALLEAATDEDESIVMTAVADAIVRRARASEAEEILELEHRMRAPVRATFAVLLAQLGAEESDAWLVERLSSPPGTELRPALVEVAEIARARREALLPRVLDAVAARQPPLLVTWLASLEDERARGTLLALSLAPSASRTTALEGLAHLGPDGDTAQRLGELVHGSPAFLAPELARALLAADPSADVSPMLETTNAPLRLATLAALVQRSPERAVALLGADPSAIVEADREVMIEAALAHASPPLAPWLEGIVRDEALARTHGERALEALVAMPRCELLLDEGVLVEEETRRLAALRLGRRCPLRAVEAHVLASDDVETSLHLRAIAGEDVREAIAARWVAEPARDARLSLAHAWLASVAPDARIASALEGEDDAEIVAVLVLAARAHGVLLASQPRARLVDRASRLAALEAMRGAPREASPLVARELARASVDGDPAVAANALHVLEARAPAALTARLCAALESPHRALARAARHLLAARAERPVCVLRRARVDRELRRSLVPGTVTDGDETPAQPLVLRVASNVGGTLLRVTIETMDGLTSRIRPPRDGLVVVPGLGEVDVGLRLDAEPDLGDR